MRFIVDVKNDDILQSELKSHLEKLGFDITVDILDAHTLANDEELLEEILDINALIGAL